MKLLVLLVLAGLASASDLQLGDRIVATEQECGRIYQLNENWSTKYFHEQAAQYVDLFFICVDSLNEDKYAYIDENKVDMSSDDKNNTFPVETSEGEKLVTKPAPRNPNEAESMKKKLSEYLKKTGGMKNPIYRVMSIQSEMSQEIVDKQIECEALALYLLRHPDDEDGQPQHIDCINNLNCMKEKFMEQHKFTRQQFPDFFPILYKRRGTMIRTPPQLGKSVCETLDSPEGSKRELEKWMSGIEYIGSKLTDIGEAGTEFIQNLVQKGMGGGDKVLTGKELDDLMTDVQSVTITDDNGKDDKDDGHTYKVYGDLMMEKLAELESKGIKIAHAQLEKAKPAIEKVQNIASLTGEKLKTLQEVNLIPTVEKTAHGLSNAKEQSKNAFEGVKDGLTIAGSVAKMATSKVKGEGSILMSKLKPNSKEDANDEEATEITDNHEQDHETASDNSQGTLSTLIDHMIHPEYLPEHYGDTQPPGLLQILKDMGEHREDGKDKFADDELKILNSLKESTRKRAQDLHLSKDEVKQSADIVKGVMHALLSAASHGYGAAKGMSPQEIHKAKLLVDKMVSYATAEIVNKDDGILEEKDEEEASSYKGDTEDNHLTVKDLAEDGVTQEQVTKTTKTDEVTSEDNNTTPTVSEETDQTAADTRGETDESKPGDEEESDEENQETAIPEKEQDLIY